MQKYKIDGLLEHLMWVCVSVWLAQDLSDRFYDKGKFIFVFDSDIDCMHVHVTRKLDKINDTSDSFGGRYTNNITQSAAERVMRTYGVERMCDCSVRCQCVLVNERYAV